MSLSKRIARLEAARPAHKPITHEQYLFAYRRLEKHPEGYTPAMEAVDLVTFRRGGDERLATLKARSPALYARLVDESKNRTTQPRI